MLYFTADLHAYQEKWVEQIHPVLKEGDTIIVGGDFGVGFLNGRFWSEETFFDWLAQKPYTVLIVDGNHENFHKLEGYPQDTYCGGAVHRIRDNVLHLRRGEIYNLNGQYVFVFGGGYSMDRYRRREGITWWPQEMPSEEEYRRGEENLQKRDRKVDVIITHTCPLETVQYLASCDSGIRGPLQEELPLNLYLDRVQAAVAYRHWYFGHFHVDRELWRNQSAVFNCIRNVETGKIVRSWQTYEHF